MKKLNEMLGIKYPLIQGGMARAATGSFAAAISNIGALGVIGSGAMDYFTLQKEIQICKNHTDRPYGVNLIMNHRDIAAFAQLVIDEKVPVVITGNGDASKYIRKWKNAGITVIPVIGSPVFAKFMERAGADAIIAEGNESGGHIGPMTTMTLVPQVCDNTSLPVVAAGGIADYRQFKAAEALGACGVQVGTALLVSEECPIHENYKKMLLKSKSSSNIITGMSLGDPIRVISNQMSRRYLKMEKEGAGKEELSQLAEGGLARAAIKGDVEEGSVMAGLVCGQLNRICPASNIIASICGEEER
ncbi:nitronate monooxygenase [Lachnospiraceae bacterium 62-35]